MSVNNSGLTRTQLGKEVTPGTAVACPRMLGSTMDFNMQPKGSQFIVTTEGGKAPDGVSPTRQWSEFSATGFMDMNEAGLWLNGYYTNAPTLNSPATGVYERRWSSDQYAADTVDTYTIQRGNDVVMNQWAFCTITGYSIKCMRESDSIALTLNGFGSAMSASVSPTAGANEVQTVTVTATSGTFAISFRGLSYTAAFDVTTAALQTALRALASVGAGNVTVTGTAGTTYVITFVSAKAGKKFELFGIDAALAVGGTVTIAETTPGGLSMYLTSLEKVGMPVSQKVVYLDTSAAAIGTTIVSKSFETDFDGSGRFNMVWQDRIVDFGFNEVSENDYKGGLKETMRFKLEVDDTAMGYVSFTSGQVLYARIEIISLQNIIGTSTKYCFRHDTAIRVLADPINFGSVNGVTTLEFTGQVLYSPSYGKRSEVYLRGGVAAY